MEPRHSKWKEYVEYKIARNKFHKLIGLEFVNIQPGMIEAERFCVLYYGRAGPAGIYSRV